MAASTDDERQVKPFAAFLHEQRGGLLAAELSEQFNEMVEACATHGKVGQLTLTIKVKPTGGGHTTSVLVVDDVKVKRPEGERAPSVFFVDDDHNLTREDPTAPRLPLQEVAPTPSARDRVREVGT